MAMLTEVLWRILLLHALHTIVYGIHFAFSIVISRCGAVVIQ
jgi:hypothetical protein